MRTARFSEALHPHVFTDPMVGGGTSVEVVREMGIERTGSQRLGEVWCACW